MNIRSINLIATIAFASFAIPFLSGCSGLRSKPAQAEEATVPEREVGQGHWVRDERNRPKYVW